MSGDNVTVPAGMMIKPILSYFSQKEVSMVSSEMMTFVFPEDIVHCTQQAERSGVP